MSERPTDGPRVRAVLEEFAGIPRARIEQTFAYQSAAFGDACADLWDAVKLAVEESRLGRFLRRSQP
jgi:hypothetical protein